MRSSNRLFRGVIPLMIVLWLGVSFAASAAMYYLWWQRERMLYLRKEPDRQREIVWERAGLPLDLLITIRRVQKLWPEDTTYTFTGEHDKKSYAAYLLLPRIPSGSNHYVLDTSTDFSPADKAFDTVRQVAVSSPVNGFFALIFSVISVAGVAAFIRSIFSLGRFSFPECFGLSCLILYASGIVSKLLFKATAPGFLFFLTIALSGLLIMVYHRFFLSPGEKPLSLNNEGAKALRYTDISPLGYLSLLIIFLGIAWSFIMSVVVVPDDWDAWAIWGAKAKLLLLSSGGLADTSFVGHPDYPLLWPVIWAFSAWFSGGWEELWSRGWGSVFLLLCAWEIVVITYRLTGEQNMALLAAALLVSIPMVPLVASWSYAEMPFLFLTTACAGCLLMRNHDNSWEITTVAALLALAAAYTKNEGVMFALLASVWLVFLPGNRKIFATALFLLIIGVLYAPWKYWLFYDQAVRSHATEGLQFNMARIIYVAGRVEPAIHSILRMWLDVKQWNIVLYILLVTPLVAVFVKKIRILFFLPVMMLTGYFTIIVFHHADIYWQVGTAWNRLTLHAVPLLIIASVSLLATPRSSVR